MCAVITTQGIKKKGTCCNGDTITGGETVKGQECGDHGNSVQVVCLAGYCVCGGGQGHKVCQLQGEALWVLTGGGEGGAEREGWFVRITGCKGGHWEPDKGEGEERESCEGGCSERPHIR